jgi:hypothetical protein
MLSIDMDQKIKFRRNLRATSRQIRLFAGFGKISVSAGIPAARARKSLSTAGPLRASLVFHRPNDQQTARPHFAMHWSPPIRRFSSAVEQRFCKPKVGSSILSTGTTI